MNQKEIIKKFHSPPVAYRGKPFWSWNGELRGEELVRQAHIMKEMGLGGYFMHSRSGLITEYLGDEWFELVNEVADAAEADGMEAWLYDEDRWPSGSAGGKVTVDPQYRMKSLYIYESDPEKVDWNAQSFALYAAKLDGINLYTYREIDTASIACCKCAADKVRETVAELTDLAKDEPGEWKALRFAIIPDAPSSGYNGTTYIDTMSRKATDKFIEMTHEEYAKRCGDRIGRSIKGIFTDEPHRGHCMDNRAVRDGIMSCAMAWTDDIFEEFEKRYGFACRPILPELFYRKNGEMVAPVKLHYIDLADALFLERFAIPINDWCKAHNMIFTGHVLHEDSLMNQTAPHGSLMRFYEHMGYPGVDVLTEHNRNYWIVKQLSSAARQLGQKWMLSELYGAVGWPFDFKGHKAVGDWQALFGINVRCQHLSWYTMEGEAKRDYPASILHQSPWYHDHGKVEDYFARFGLVMSEGRADCDVLLLNPIESLWCQAYAGWAHSINNASPDVEPYEVRYRQLFHFLTGNQIDFDYGEEEMMSRHASVDTVDGMAILRVGQAAYKTVIVSNMLTIRPTTLALLKDFIAKGGKVIFCGDAPTYVNAVASDEPVELSKKGVPIPFDEASLVAAVREGGDAFVSVTNGEGNTEKTVFAQVRRDFGGDGYAVVVLNTDRQNPRRGLTLSLKAPAGYTVEEWDLDTADRYDASAISDTADGLYRIHMDLEAGGTRCLVFSRSKDETLSPLPDYVTVAAETLTGEFPYTCDEPNACVLDWCKWRWKGQEWHDEAEVLWADRQIRTDVGIEWRGGGMLQPWYSKTHDTKEYGELQLSYEFWVDQMPETPVYLAGERPELNTYRINGVTLRNTDINDFWIDDCFKKMAIPADALKLGRNEVTVDVAFKRTTNVEALYLVGNFGVKLEGRKRSMVELPARMGCANYADYHMPFFTGNLTYTISPEMYLPLLGDTVTKADRIVLTPKEFTGACVKVTAAGKRVILGWEPYEADVTEAVQNRLPIFVTVEGTRTNLFGPLHEVAKPAGLCSPGNFVTTGDQWTDDYSLLKSGLRGFTFKAQNKK
ncbi:MAG: hypothetical protein E7661_05110 [Ruminococcaceae bacterium]|nr:hypothetical protein [Oscillospiraceae bacterium]